MMDPILMKRYGLLPKKAEGELEESMPKQSHSCPAQGSHPPRSKETPVEKSELYEAAKRTNLRARRELDEVLKTIGSVYRESDN